VWALTESLAGAVVVSAGDGAGEQHAASAVASQLNRWRW
jgi:hypothetical protein